MKGQELDARVGIATASLYKPPPNGSYYQNLHQVSRLIREALIQGGLGEKDPDAPLTDIIQPGMTVLLKPNWVLHYNQSGKGMECMVTHPNFILATLKEVMATHPKKVIIGDAPIQLGDFAALSKLSWRKRIEQTATCPVSFIDFRKEISLGETMKNGMVENIRDDKHYILFDLGTDSLLEPVSRPQNNFRVTNYNPNKLKKTHRPGRHQYLLCREAFDVDIILSLPKLKTHKKAGITAALKNLVGLNGLKSYLPHHRLGGSVVGGDCYPGLAPLKRGAEFFLDIANRSIGKPAYSAWHQAASILLNLQRKFGDADLEGSWYGNDTVWRMTLDLNRILLYGRSDGSLAEKPIRTIYSLTDGITAGQGEGPLAPAPVNLGVVTFASSPCFGDLIHSALAHFSWEKIPLVRSSFERFRFPLTDKTPNDCRIYQESRQIPLKELSEKFGLVFEPPKGWKDHIEIERAT